MNYPFHYVMCPSDFSRMPARVSGRPLIKEFIYKPLSEKDPLKESEMDYSDRIFDLASAYCDHGYIPTQDLNSGDTHAGLVDYVMNISNQAPNLTLGSQGRRPCSWGFAVLGIIAQASVIWSTGIITLYFQRYKSIRPFSPRKGYIVFTCG